MKVTTNYKFAGEAVSLIDKIGEIDMNDLRTSGRDYITIHYDGIKDGVSVPKCLIKVKSLDTAEEIDFFMDIYKKFLNSKGIMAVFSGFSTQFDILMKGEPLGLRKTQQYMDEAYFRYMFGELIYKSLILDEYEGEIYSLFIEGELNKNDFRLTVGRECKLVGNYTSLPEAIKAMNSQL